MGPLTKGSRILVKFGSKSKVPLAGFSGRRHQTTHVQGTEHTGTHRQTDRLTTDDRRGRASQRRRTDILSTYLTTHRIPFLSSAGLTD